MDQNGGLTTRGYYSVVRYRPDPVREEFRNVGVLLVGESGEFRGLRALRPGSISRSVEEQGLLAGVITAVERRLDSAGGGLAQLRELADAYSHSILFSDPQPAMTRGGPQALLESLYGALVAPKAHPPVGFTKGHVLDRLDKWFSARGSSFDIGTSLDGYSFDAVLRTPQEVVYAMHVTSFAARQLNSKRVEQEVGHFLFASARVDARCIGVLQPAPSAASGETRHLQERVSRWFDDAGVPALSPSLVRETIGVAASPMAIGPRQLQLSHFGK